MRRRALALGLAALLPGCGFQPVYMPTASGKAGPAQRGLAAVNVPLLPDRPGQLLREALQGAFQNDSGTPSEYDLQVSYGISGEGVGILNTAVATRVRLIGTASWSLLARDPQRTKLASGTAKSQDGLNVFDSQYFASDLGTEAAQKRIAETIARQIATQLGVWFRQQAAKAAG
jgi:hypothetical protein